MSTIESMTAEGELLRVVAAGPFSHSSARENFLEILVAVAEHRSSKVLVDARQMTGEPTALFRFLYGQFVGLAVGRFRMKHYDPQFAYVAEPPLLDPARLGERAAVSRGMNVKAFDNVEDALRWLGVEPSDK